MTTAIPANTTPAATSPHPGMPPKSRMYQGSRPIGYFLLRLLMAATVRRHRYGRINGSQPMRIGVVRVDDGERTSETAPGVAP
ncbi:hypothetical protein [Microbacterium dauci]|uniref:Uncharacterized protein n=1 Tax=Microbacterium dauci TaxID=3048008 RepID=A0ABT6ZEA8_9MICO|nr:hypothetical protein [Microbacterium sp. LX3-4]MDJ1114483.1 hypothetical protein [Microbacterium sp. LX3-4]